MAIKARWMLCLVVLGFTGQSSGVDTKTTAVGSVEPSHSATTAHENNTSRFSREQWGLTEQEWSRYQGLLLGIRGSVSPATLSPIEVLGIHATTDAERNDYARRWAQTMKEDTERILAFQHAYDTAWRQLNPSGQIVDVQSIAPSQARHDEIPVQTGDRLLLFIRIENCETCDRYTKAARNLQEQKDLQLDIFIVGTASDDAIRQWADRQNFARQTVVKKKVTFNHERGELAQLSKSPTVTVPKLIRLRNNRATFVEPNNFTRG